MVNVTAELAPSAPVAPGDGAKRRRITATVSCIAAFMVFVDATIVSVALPAVARSLRSGNGAEASLTLTVYATMLAALLIPSGRLADYLGRRRLFVVGLVGFTATSLLCGLSGSLMLLIIARTLQGGSAALMAPASLALLLAEFPQGRQAHALGIWSIAAGAAAAVGPGIGGILVSFVGWRAVFLVNVPVGILGSVVAHRRLRETRIARAPKPDVLSASLGALAAVAFTTALFQVANRESLSEVSWLLASVATAAGAGCWWRGARTSNALLEGALDGGTTAWAASAATVLTSAAGYALLFANVFFLQSIWHYSPLRQGLAVTPAPIITALIVAPAGKAADRFGTVKVALPGVLLLAAGAVWFCLETGATGTWAAVWLPGATMTGAGIGLSFPTIAAAALAGSNPTSLSTAVALNGTFRQIGAVGGIAAVAVIAGVHPGTQSLIAIHSAWLLVASLSLSASVALVVPGLLRLRQRKAIV